jgi:hypothetical protein
MLLDMQMALWLATPPVTLAWRGEHREKLGSIGWETGGQ